MPIAERKNLAIDIGRIKPSAEIQCLADLMRKLNKPRDVIANFGCDTGHETFRLMWALDATEAVGVDKDSEDIRKALDFLSDVQKHVRAFLHALQYKRVPVEDREWWKEQVPDFLKGQRWPEFVEKDITEPTGLENNHYDLVYCDYVLYHILDEQGEEKVENAIREMTRIAKLDGWIVAIEPIDLLEDDTQIDLGHLFEAVNLTPILDAKRIIKCAAYTTYLYKKGR